MNVIRLQAEAMMAQQAFEAAAIGLAMWSLGSCLSIAAGLEKSRRDGRDQERRDSGYYGMDMYAPPMKFKPVKPDIYWYRDELRKIEEHAKQEVYDWMKKDLRKKS